MAADDQSSDDRVTVGVDGQFELGPETVDALERRTGRYDVVCSSGERETGEWRGVPVGRLLDRAEPPAGATHLLVTGTDGYRVCVPLTAALDALLALERIDAPDDGSLPRFLGEAVDGTRSVKHVRRLETVGLTAGQDPSDYEARPPEA